MGGEDLDRDGAIETSVPRPVDFAHAARAERTDNLGTDPDVFRWLTAWARERGSHPNRAYTIW